jgi:hypothetical protein
MKLNNIKLFNHFGNQKKFGHVHNRYLFKAELYRIVASFKHKDALKNATVQNMNKITLKSG